MPGIAQPLRLIALLVLTGVAVSCSGRGGRSSVVPPVDPEAAVRTFLNAVRTENLVAMGQVWGTSQGLASRRLDAATLEQRLTVMRIYLEHQQYEIVPGNPDRIIDLRPNEQLVFVRLTRSGCTPVVPFRLVRYRSGWLISNIDFTADDNHPRRVCAPVPGDLQPSR